MLFTPEFNSVGQTLWFVSVCRSYNLHLDSDGTEIPHCSARLLSNLVVCGRMLKVKIARLALEYVFNIVRASEIRNKSLLCGQEHINTSFLLD